MKTDVTLSSILILTFLMGQMFQRTRISLLNVIMKKEFRKQFPRGSFPFPL